MTRRPPEHWDCPEKSKRRLDAVRRMLAKKKQARSSWEQDPTPGRPHPFSERELDKFHLRAPLEAKRMLKSLNRTALEHDKPRSERKLV